jgi:hypothetical protein
LSVQPEEEELKTPETSITRILAFPSPVRTVSSRGPGAGKRDTEIHPGRTTIRRGIRHLRIFEGNTLLKIIVADIMTDRKPML